MRGGDGGSPDLRKQQEYRTPLKTAQSDKRINTSQSNLKTTPQIWRSQSESFRTALKAARDVTAALASGKPLPPPVVYSDPSLVPCPNCSRRFNVKAAERHIPICSKIIAKPTMLIRGTGRGQQNSPRN